MIWWWTLVYFLFCTVSYFVLFISYAKSILFVNSYFSKYFKVFVLLIYLIFVFFIAFIIFAPILLCSTVRKQIDTSDVYLFFYFLLCLLAVFPGALYFNRRYLLVLKNKGLFWFNYMRSSNFFFAFFLWRTWLWFALWKRMKTLRKNLSIFVWSLLFWILINLSILCY